MFVAFDCSPIGTICIDHQPRSRSQWWIGSVSGRSVGSSRVGSRPAPQAAQAGLPSVPEADSIGQAAAAMVTGTNCWLAQTHLSEGTAKPSVTRDDLSQPVHSGPWGAEKRAA